MKHLGDITKIDWAQVEPVDCVIGGSPCQDLSTAGKRAGLAGERSGLFMEQIRCIKELRKRDKDAGRTDVNVRPRYMVWENVPGAFSSKGGADFAAVLEETIKIVRPECPPIDVPKEGWHKAGCIYDDEGNWSVAWRVHDAQYHGVPQRRRRISLVADFGGLSAPQILFERKSVSGDSAESRAPGKETSGNAGKSAAGFNYRMGSKAGNVGYQVERSTTLSAKRIDAVVYGVDGYNSAMCPDTQPSLGVNCGMSTGRKGVLVCDPGGNGNGQVAPTAVCVGNGQMQNISMKPVANSLDCMHDQQAILAIDCRNSRVNPEKSGTLQSKPTGGYSLNYLNPVACFDTTQVTSPTNRSNPKPGAPCHSLAAAADPPLLTGTATVRRLTPLECERLQGFPDGWTDIGDWVDSKGKTHKLTDTPRYKALGNSIALPFWQWLINRISAQYETVPTMGSLFDGIGGFPLCWERCNGKGTARWASEIEEFPMAVTKYHFKEDTP